MKHLSGLTVSDIQLMILWIIFAVIKAGVSGSKPKKQPFKIEPVHDCILLKKIGLVHKKTVFKGVKISNSINQ